MPAGIVYSQEQVDRAFTEKGCTKLPGQGINLPRVGRHEMWITKWGHMFMAPASGCGHWVIADIIAFNLLLRKLFGSICASEGAPEAQKGRAEPVREQRNMNNSILSELYFHNEEAAYEYVEKRLWPHGPVCPH